MEFAFVTPTESPWAAEALYLFMTYMTEGELIQWGDRFPFGFQQHSNGSLGVYTGQRTADIRAVGAIQAVLFWPFLFPQSTFLTGTGKFLVMVATGITRNEWELAKTTTTAHVLLLLCRAGIAQRTLPDRECLMASPRWRDEWTRIKALAPEACEREFESRIDHWHVG